MEYVFEVCNAIFCPCVKVERFFVTSGLFQMGVKFEDANMESVILWNFHQAVRAEAIVIASKHGWCLIAKLRDGVSKI